MNATKPEQVNAGATSAAWSDDTLANPHAVADKAKRVEAMFSAIAPSYDLNNRVHSMGRDQAWRRLVVRMAELRPGDVVLDVATGTGDLAFQFLDTGWGIANRHGNPPIGKPTLSVLGVDFTYNMLAVAKQKESRRRKSEKPAVVWATGDAMNLPLPDASVDVVTIAFGIRNVAVPERALREFYRVLRPNGRLLILEFSLPQNKLLRSFYNFYFRRIMPYTATWIARDRTGAYRYLPQSVNTFINRDTLTRMMAESGFVYLRQLPVTFGIAVIYRGTKAAHMK